MIEGCFSPGGGGGGGALDTFMDRRVSPIFLDQVFHWP